MKPRLLFISLMLLLAVVACRKGPVEVHSTEDEYVAAEELFRDKQVAIYSPLVTKQEENRRLIALEQERIRLALLHAATSPSALDKVTRSTDHVSRQDLRQVYESLNPGMQKTKLGQALRKHIEKKTPEVGDPLPHFEGVGIDGKPFDWSVTDGKRVLLIYEGWGWIKRSTHFWFKDLLAATDRDSLAVVAYVYAENMADFQKRVKAFQLEPYLLISDLQGKEGPLDKKMGIRGIPTYYYTDRRGRIRRIIGGFQPELFVAYTGLSPEWGENWPEE